MLCHGKVHALQGDVLSRDSLSSGVRGFLSADALRNLLYIFAVHFGRSSSVQCQQWHRHFGGIAATLA